MPSTTTCHSLTTQTTQALLPSESAQTQEAIKVLKTTKGDHDVIEIATKYMPSSFAQEVAHREQSSVLPSEDIIVDMKYQDAKKTDSATSELNIVHAAPQSFETVLVEPDDVTTEVVVDADGTKRIIVRKLRRTTVTSRQTTQQRVSTLSTALGDASPMMQAFSEAAMRDQQITVTRTRPDGTIETTTKQMYGGRVTTAAPTEGINVAEYESEPHYTRMVTQGQIGDISCQPVEEEILMEGGEYQTSTSSVHAVVQQVVRRVIKRTRKIIRKVIIIDGKETTTEEVIEEPEEVEIDEQDIPHISINVVKSEDQKTLVPGEKSIDTKVEQHETTGPKIPMEPCTPGSPMQGPFFGPFAKDMVTTHQAKTEKKTTETPTTKDDNVIEVETLDIESQAKESAALQEPTVELADSKIETDTKVELPESAKTATGEPVVELPMERLPSPKEDVPQAESLINVQADEDVSFVRDDESVAPRETIPTDKHEHEHFPAEVNGVGTLTVDNQALLIGAEQSDVLQTPVEDASVSATQADSIKSPLEPAATDDEPVVTKATCKSDDAPVKSETPSIELENGTVEVETHHDDSSTIEAGKDVDVLTVVVLEEEIEGTDKPGISEKDASFEPSKNKEEDTILTLSQKSQPQDESVVPPSESDAIKPDESIEILAEKPEISSKLFIKEEEDDLEKDEALKPEYKPVFHKVEISLSVRKEDEETEPLVSIKTRAERPEIAPYRIVKEDVDISLPADKEKIKVIHDKIVQTSAFLTAEKETETFQQQVPTAEKEIDVHIESEKSKSDSASHKSRKKKRHKTKPEPTEKPVETESSTSIATSVAESMEIIIPSSDSSKHASEQPQPDVAEIMKSITESSLSLDDYIIPEDNGYQADDKTMDELSVAPEDEDGTKKKRKKKKKQKVRLTRDDELTQVPKSSSDDATFTDNSLPLEIPKLEKMTEEDKPQEDNAMKDVETVEEDETKEDEIAKQEDKVEEEEIKTIALQEESIVTHKVTLDDANTQTTVETCDVSTELTPKADKESLSTFTQTSPEPVPLTLEEEIQTARTEETHIETQTILEPGLDFSAQTVAEETPEVEDSGVQTATPTATLMEELAVQTSPIEYVPPAVVETEMEDSQAQTVEIDILSTEMQTSPVEVAPMIASETQTAINAVMEVEQQTTPSPVEEKVALQEMAIQTSSPEVPESLEKDMQTSIPSSPEQPDVSHIDTQTIAAPEVPAETTETQTTPEESPRQIELQETEMQTKSPEPTIETTMQTSPVIVSPEPAQMCEESAQTSIEEARQTTEEESQTSSPERTQTLDSSVQIKTTELIPCVEESVQNIPETCEISAQTSPKEEKQTTETTSVSQQTAQIPTHTVEVSTEDLQAEIGEIVDAQEAPITMEPVISEETEKEVEVVSTKLLETPAAPDVQVPETARSLEEVKEEEIADDKPESVQPTVVPTTIPESTEEIEAPVGRETRDQLPELPELPATRESPRPLEDGAKAKGSTTSSISEKDTTPDTSFEIHVQATIELSASDTLDSVASGSKESPDTSQETTVAEDLNNDAGVAEHDSKAAKRQRRKRKHKTMEISLPSKTELGSIFGQAQIESQDITLKLSYSDVIKKNASKQTSPVGDVLDDILDDVASEYVSQTTPRLEPDLKSEDIASRTVIESTKEDEGGIQDIPDVSTTSKTVPTSTIDQFAIDSSRNIPEATAVPEVRMPFVLGRPTIESLLIPSEQQKLSTVLLTQSSPEPMDTTEEPLTPVEVKQPILSKDETSKPFRTEIKTYAEVISESDKKSAPPSLTSGERYEKKEAYLWKEPAVKAPSPHALSATFLLKESLEYGVKPQHQATQAIRLITDRVKSLQNTNESSHLGNILHIAHLEEVTTERLAEERSSDVRRELAQLRNAVQENDVVVVEETLVTVVETISTWLETIEYRIFLNRKCPTGPSHEDTRTFIELKDEVNHVEESIRELDNIWKQVEPAYPEEERERLQECVNALEHQVKIIEHVTTDGEKHASSQLARWDEFLNGVNNVYR